MEDVLAKLDALCSRLDDLLAELQRVVEKRPSPYAKLRETYPNAGKPWSAADDDELRLLYREGKPVEALALHFGRTANGMRQRLERLGFAASELAVEAE
jgi:hypothetical protein